MSFTSLAMLRPAASAPLLCSTGPHPALTLPHGAAELRDIFQNLAYETVAVYNMGRTASTPIKVRERMDAYVKALRNVPAELLEDIAVADVNALIHGVLRGEEAAQQRLPSAVHSLTHYLFGHRPHWMITDENVEDIGPASDDEIVHLKSDSLFDYRVRSYGRDVPVLPADPAGLTLDGYQLAVETTLLMLLTRESPYQIIFVPGFRSTGKTNHVISHLTGVLRKQYGKSEVLRIDTISPKHGIGYFKRRTRGKQAPLFTLVDNVPHLDHTAYCVQKGRFHQYGRNYLQGHPERKLVLFGGTNNTVNHQNFVMTDTLRELIGSADWTDKWTSLSMEAKPLNAVQAYQVLIGDLDWLSEEECQIYVDFIMHRCPPFLTLLRRFALMPKNMGPYARSKGVDMEEYFTNLRSALEFARFTYRSIGTHLFNAAIEPARMEQEENIVTRAIQDIIDNFPEDIMDAVARANELEAAYDDEDDADLDNVD